MRPQDCYTLPPKRRRRLRFIVLPLIGSLIAIAFIRVARQSRSFSAPTVSLTQPPVSIRPNNNSLPEPATADALLADVYPSQQSAVRALALRLPDTIGQISDKPSDFRLTFDDRPLGGAPLYDALRRHFPTARLAGPGDQSPPSANAIAIALVVDNEPAQSPRRAAKGNVQVKITGPSRATALSAKFAQCDWADDLTDYINEHPGHTWIVARSQRPCLSPSEARRAAEEAAADALSQWLQDHNAPNLAPINSREPLAMPLRGNIRNRLPISDRFVQQFHRTYGDVWSESVLLDVSPQWVDNIHHQQAGAVRLRQTRIQTTAASMAVVLFTILLAYSFANVVTRRYFTGRLRAIAIVSALIAVAVAVGIISVV